MKQTKSFDVHHRIELVFLFEIRFSEFLEYDDDFEECPDLME